MIYGGGVRTPVSVIYFNAVLYNPDVIDDPDSIVSELSGMPIIKSAVFDFTHTDYYVKEMGRPLHKYFACYGLIDTPEILPDFKLRAVEIEDRFLKDDKRTINIDPGYVALEKVVAASTKNFPHRVYIKDGIFGDIQLYRRKGQFNTLQWTFQDYAFDFVVNFFEECRNTLKTGLDSGD